MASSARGACPDGHRLHDGSQKPSPLRIVKRFGSQDSLCGPHSFSLRSDASPHGQSPEDGCLTVMKRRRGRGHDFSPVDDDNDNDGDGGNEPRRDAFIAARSGIFSKKYNWEEGMGCRGGMDRSQTLHASKPRQPRQSIHDHPGLRLQCASSPSIFDCPPGNDPLEDALVAQMDNQSAESAIPLCSRDLGGMFRHQSASHPSHGKSCVLSPHVSVTAEVNAIEGNQRTIWAAIEVSGRLSTVSSKGGGTGRNGVTTGTIIEHELDRYFEFGCLYDLVVDVLPTEQTSVVQVLREQTFPTTIYAGSSVLLLAELRISLDQKRFQRPGHIRQKSEDLIEDLEIQLGSSQVNYMQIKVSYAHSAFPESACQDNGTGISSTHSRIETLATASLKRHAVLSPWSPRPAPSANALLQLLGKHWGDDKASEAMQMMLATRACARKPAKPRSPFLKERNKPNVPGSLPTGQKWPIVPTRKASLQKTLDSECCTQNSGAESCREALASNCSTDSVSDQAEERSKESRSPTSRSCASDEDSSEEGGIFVRKKATMGRDGLKSLFPDLADFIPANHGVQERAERPMTATGNERGKKRTGRWAWATWF